LTIYRKCYIISEGLALKTTKAIPRSSLERAPESALNRAHIRWVWRFMRLVLFYNPDNLGDCVRILVSS
jgi:hypothetical protein